MSGYKRWLIASAIGLQISLAGCDWLQPEIASEKAREEAQQRTLDRRLKTACGSPATYDRLKLVMFDEAIRIRNADPVNLDTLATHATVRVEQPVVKSHDSELNITVCRGRFVLQVPPGAERAFGGERNLVADIEYAAQPAADGSGLVYQIRGAEPIIYKLAAFDLRRQAYRPADQSIAADEAGDTRLAQADLDEPPVAAAERPATPVSRPAPEPRPMRAAPPPPPPPPPPRREARAEAEPPRREARTEAEPPRRSGSSSPSFNCRNARTRSEKMVCSSDRLAGLDRRMSALYYSALEDADSGTRAELRRSRDRFLAHRDRCSSQGCVAEAYQDRMDEIRDIAEGY